MKIAFVGLAALLLTSCQAAASGPPQSSDNPYGSPVAVQPSATLSPRRAFSHVQVSGVNDDDPAQPKDIVARSEAELTAALHAQGLDRFPDAAETTAAAVKSVDFTKETAILVDQGLVPSMTQTVEPIDARETGQGITVRYALKMSEIDLPALNRPYAILAIPKTDKPVTTERQS